MSITIIRNGAQLQEEHKNSLIQPITDEDIWSALTHIGDNKSLLVLNFSKPLGALRKVT